MTTENFVWTDELVKNFTQKFMKDLYSDMGRLFNKPQIHIDIELSKFKEANFEEKKYSIKEIQEAYSQEAGIGSPLYKNFLNNLTKIK